MKRRGRQFFLGGDDSRTRLEEFLDIYPSGGKDSLANPMDNDLRRILDEIGDAPIIVLSTDAAEFFADLAVDIAGFRAWAVATSEEDSKLSLVMAFLFASKEAAETALANSDFIDELRGDETVSVIYGPNRKGELVVTGAEVAIESSEQIAKELIDCTLANGGGDAEDVRERIERLGGIDELVEVLADEMKADKRAKKGISEERGRECD